MLLLDPVVSTFAVCPLDPDHCLLRASPAVCIRASAPSGNGSGGVGAKSFANPYNVLRSRGREMADLATSADVYSFPLSTRARWHPDRPAAARAIATVARVGYACRRSGTSPRGRGLTEARTTWRQALAVGRVTSARGRRELERRRDCRQ